MISIIMGVYESLDFEKTEIALKSILNQTFDEFEFIICFDGSSIDTVNNVKEILKNDSRIVYLYNEINKGLAYSLNKCLENASGKYIARMDIDDYVSLSRFEIQVDYLQNNPDVDFISNFAKTFDDQGIWGERVNPISPTKNDFLFNSPFIHASVMIKNEVLKSVDGYRVSKETYRMEDYDLWMRLYSEGYFGRNLTEYLYFIREDKDALSRRKYRYRIDEAIVRFKGFKLLKLFPKGIPFVIKPLIVGLIPNRLLYMIKGVKR